MKEIKTNIIPEESVFVNLKGEWHIPDLKAICIFAATGFFLDQDTYWEDRKVLKPGTVNLIDENGCLVKSTSWFNWHYSPEEVNFNSALANFENLFEKIIAEQTQNSPVILPLSGGLDSRTQALALSRLKRKVTSYSYSFERGFPEAEIARKVAGLCNFEFTEYTIPESYLWNNIDELAKINQCYSEFTHPRQMALLPDFKKMNGVFSLGHWGDVLFDSGLNSKELHGDLHKLAVKKIIKRGGAELAERLWKTWDLEGEFMEYLSDRILDNLNAIKIDNVSSKMRAFKSLCWAPRWTSVNLAIFKKAKPITLPYYDNRMCEFVCKLPEEFLAGRKMQLAYLRQNKSLSSITWEDQKPFNLHNYLYNKVPYNLPYRISKKLEREYKSAIGKPYVQRNWELQFVGEKNEKHLEEILFKSNNRQLVPLELAHQVFRNFQEKDRLYWSHPLSMLLTLSIWDNMFRNAEEN